MCSSRTIAAIALPTVFDGLSVAEASIDEARDLNIQLGSQRIDDRKVFIIRGSDFAGYVIAGVIFWHEDEGHHFDESYFQQSFLSART
jgi:hypothetical protein